MPPNNNPFAPQDPVPPSPGPSPTPPTQPSPFAEPAQPFGQPQPPVQPLQPLVQPPSNFGPSPVLYSSPRPKPKIGLIIAVVVGVLLLVGVIAALALNPPKFGGGSTDTTDVKKVSWVTPANIPEGLEKADRSTPTLQLGYITDAKTSCTITSAVFPLVNSEGQPTSVNQALADSSAAAEKSGVKEASNVAGPQETFKDADGGQEYTFETRDLLQDLTVASIDFKQQVNHFAYAQFGSALVTIRYSCRSDTWEANQAKLADIVKQFTLKIER